MELYILRHGEAGPALHDEDRMLTEKGQSQAGAAAKGIAELGLGLTAILSSPLPRAMQTAQPVAQAVGVPIEQLAELATGQSAEEAVKALSARIGPVMIVGHEPQLSAIVQLLTGGQVHMRKAMLAAIEEVEFEPPSGSLAALLTWKHLGRVAKK